MGRQGRDFGGQGGERRFEGSRGGQDFRGRGAPPRGDGERRSNFRGAGEQSRGPDFRDRRDAPRSFGSGGGDRRPSYAGQDDRGGARPNNYRRPEGAQGGYGRGPAPAARFDDTPRRPAPAPASVPAAAAPRASIVSAAQLKGGIGQANKALAEVIEQFGHTLRGDYDIGAIEVTVSFAADGRFLGFGSGGAASMKLQLTPLDAESVLEGAGDDDDFAVVDENSADDEDTDDVESDEALTDGPSAPSLDEGSEAPHFDA